MPSITGVKTDMSVDPLQTLPKLLDRQRRLAQSQYAGCFADQDAYLEEGQLI